MRRPAARPGRARQFWTRVHRWAGLATAAFLAVAGLTGALIAFPDELDRAINPGLFIVPPRGQPMLSLEDIADRMRRHHPDLAVRRIFPAPRGDRSVRVSVLPRPGGAAPDASEIYLDPYDGRVLGSQQWRSWRWDRANVVPFVFRLHYTLHLPGRLGFWLMGGVAVAWLVDCLVGFYLTLPARMHHRAGRRGWWRRWSAAWKVRTEGGAYRLTYDLHRAAGLWLWAVLFCLALSAACLNLRSELAVPILQRLGTVSPSPAARLPRADAAARRTLSYDEAAARARQSLAGPQQDYVLRYAAYLPERNAYRLVFQEPQWQAAAFRVRDVHQFIGAGDGAVLSTGGYDAGTATDRFLALQYPIHSGAILGFPGRLIVCAAGLAVALLSVTGVLVSWKKAKAREARLRRRAVLPRGLPP